MHDRLVTSLILHSNCASQEIDTIKLDPIAPGNQLKKQWLKKQSGVLRPKAQFRNLCFKASTERNNVHLILHKSTC